MLSIDDDDGTTEYDPHEHAESLRHGIPDHFGRNLMLYIVHYYALKLYFKTDIYKKISW